MIPSNPIWSVTDLANVVKNSRREQKMTQAELARRANVSRPWISQFESGKISNPTFDRILTICDILGVRLGAEYRSAITIPRDTTSVSQSAIAQYGEQLAQQNQRAIDQIKQFRSSPHQSD
jgi:transcriptional regulator with XRE-family HTH domain